VLVLGDLDPEPIETRVIRDPVEQPKEVFELSYSRIERCVEELARAVAVSAERVSSRGVPPQSQGDQDGDRNGRREQPA
jgi:hypothetical protein